MINTKFSIGGSGIEPFKNFLSVSAESDMGVPINIFVFNRMKDDTNDAYDVEFSHVATVSDMNDIPEDDHSGSLSCYRGNKCTIYGRSLRDVAMAEKLFKEDVEMLRKEILAATPQADV